MTKKSYLENFKKFFRSAEEEEAERIIKRLDGREEKEKLEAEILKDKKLVEEMVNKLASGKEDEASKIFSEIITRKIQKLK